MPEPDPSVLFAREHGYCDFSVKFIMRDYTKEFLVVGQKSLSLPNELLKLEPFGNHPHYFWGMHHSADTPMRPWR